MTVRDLDKGYKKLVARIFQFGAPKISVGIHEADGDQPHGDGGGLRMIDIATIHEFGLGNVPERSFIRAWFDENQDRAREGLRRLLQSVVSGKRTPEQAIDTFAQWCVGQIQKRIAQGIAPPLSARRIAEKGSSVPLIDTGQLRSSISYEVYGANGAYLRSALSKAGTKRAKAALREKKAAERKEAKAKQREREAKKKALVRGVKDVKKSVVKGAKQAQRLAKKATKRVQKAVKKVRRKLR